MTALHNNFAREYSNLVTHTTVQQEETESLVLKAYTEKLNRWGESANKLFKPNHVEYLRKKLNNLPSSFESLDCGQTWIFYWITHSLRLLSADIPEDIADNIIDVLASCQNKTGGFAGGPYQQSHLATSYGATNCLSSLFNHRGLSIINRPALISWLKKLKQEDGSFIMHEGGEVDVRGVYCAVSVCRMTRLLDKHPDLFDGTAEWVASCQTYEGGFGGQPGLEAHGGYTFCAVAALNILGKTNLIDLPRLLHWAVNRQMRIEGGFQGRTHKLVDSCYSFWMGALFPMLHKMMQNMGDSSVLTDEPFMNTKLLQEYVIMVCQKLSYLRPGLSVPCETSVKASSGDIPNTTESSVHKSDSTASSYLPSECSGPMGNSISPTGDTASTPKGIGAVPSGGGLIDKPGKNPDPYHTCYALSGLSIAQMLCSMSSKDEILGVEFANHLSPVDVWHNVVPKALAFCREYFRLRDEDNSVTSEEAARIAVSLTETMR